MTIYIITVLLLACGQSFCKLSLLPRRWSFAAALICGMLPFAFENRIAHSSMQELHQVITSPAVLNNWCALIVIQEILSLAAGFSLLADRAGDKTGERKIFVKYLHKLKYAVFLPSILLPGGIFYCQMYLFNYFPQLDFKWLTAITAFGTAGILLITVFGCRLLYPQLQRRILAVFHTEYLLLLPAVFLPVAAHAEFVPAKETLDIIQPVLLLLVTGTAVLISTIFFYTVSKKRKGKSNVYSHPNP